MSGKGLLAAALLTLTIWPSPRVEAQAPVSDRLLPLDQYTAEKGRRLATAHAAALEQLATTLYHCLPWTETQKHSIGFFHPKHLKGDERYVSVRLYIEQDPSVQFSSMAIEERAASMFSRYVGAMLRRMTRDAALRDDRALDGYTVILEWLKQGARGASARPVHEAIAVFMDRATVGDYLAGTISGNELAQRATILGFDGETALGPLKLAAWDDDFVATYKPKNYQLAAGVTCP